MTNNEDLKSFLEQLRAVMLDAEPDHSAPEITEELVELLMTEPEHSLRFAVSAAAGASNRIVQEDLRSAVACQNQSRIWLAINERVREVATQKLIEKDWASGEVPEWRQPNSGNGEAPVS